MPFDVSFSDKQRMDGIGVTATQIDGVTPAQLDGNVTVETMAGGDIVGEVNTDGTINIISGSLSGVQQLQVTGDADRGAGVVPIVDFINVTITGTGDQAANLGFTPGTIRNK